MGHGRGECNRIAAIVVAGLDPAIQPLSRLTDTRIKSGHDA
jgi:hypothetical protein